MRLITVRINDVLISRFAKKISRGLRKMVGCESQLTIDWASKRF